jgi:elongation factor G
VKDYIVDNIRNIGLFGHGSTGKTSLCEALLYVGGAIGRMGVIAEGNTTTDYSEEEIERKLTISLGLGHIEWKNCKVNIVDTPGYTDFAGDVAGALRVVDLVVCLLNAPSGIEVGTEHTLRQLDDAGLPRMFFVNKMDKEHASFSKSLGALVEHYGVKVVAASWPIGEAAEFKGIVDLIKMKGYAIDAGGKHTDLAIPDDVLAEAKSARERLVEAAAEADDALLEKFFESGELSEEDLQKGLKRGLREGKVFPVLCGVATTAAGARPIARPHKDSFPTPITKSPANIPSMNISRDSSSRLSPNRTSASSRW